MRDRFASTLPVWPVGDDGRCTCSLHPYCKRPGKHADPRAPETGPYAVVTGAVEHGGSGVLVIDPDVKGGVDGLQQFCDIEKVLGDLPLTLEVATPSGGAHVYVKHPGPRINGKLASAIDLKGDRATEDGLVYVIGPGSPGWVKTADPTVAVAAPAYEVTVDAPIAELPEAWLGHLLTVGTTRTSGFAPTPIDETHPSWSQRIELGKKAASEMPPSRADGQGGRALFAVCLRLVRGLELPIDTCRALIEEHFNPRCTDPDGNAYPWTTDEIFHKLEDARDRSDLPCGDSVPPPWLDTIKALAKRGREPKPPAEKSKQKIGANVSYEGERTKVSRTALTQMLFSWPDWKDVLWYDVLARKPRATDPPLEGRLTLEDGELSKGDLALIAHWLDAKGFLASKEQIEDALWTVVRSPDRQRNLIAEYFDSIPQATAAEILPTLATDVFKATDPLANVLIMKTLVAAARRARHPGTFHKGMLVLKGEQQCGKTPAVKILAGPWYHTTGNGNLADRDTILECQGKLLVEVEELSALGKADANSLKTAISRTHDVITKKYEPDGQSYARSFVLVGTTNKEEFLTDATGNARYHVVEVGMIDLARLDELRDQIWAEADYLARAGFANELDADEKKTLDEKNKTYLNAHPWEDEVARYLAGKKEVASATDVLMHILKNDLTKADTRARNAVADIMKSLGCQNMRKWKDGKTTSVWKVPDNLVAPARANPAQVVRLVGKK